MPVVDPVFTIDERKVLAHFDRLPKLLRDRLILQLGPVARQMLSIVEGAEPGTHLRSETKGDVLSNDTAVLARVYVSGGTPNDYAAAAALEYGIPGTSMRSARRTPGGWVSVHSYERKRGESVRAYRHRMRIVGLRFLRRAVTAMQAQGNAAIEQAIDDVIA